MYKNNREKLKIQCPKGHIFDMSYNSFQFGTRCPQCNGGIRLAYGDIKTQIEKNDGYKLISKKYKNNWTKLEVKCPNDHIFKISYNNFKSGWRCSVCSGKKKHTYEYIKNQIESVDGYRLLNKNYENILTKLKIQCPEDHIFEMNYGNFSMGHRCPVCWKEQSYSKEEKEILKYIKNNYNCTIIENDRTQIVNPKTGNYLELDIFLPELNKAIEYNGIYWHSKENVKNRDKLKSTQCKNKGIDLLVIEESDWIKNKNFGILDCFMGDSI